MRRRIILLAILVISATASTGPQTYDPQHPQWFRPFHPRVRREAETMPPLDISDPKSRTIPSEITVEEDDETDHIYYNMQVYTDKPEMMKDYFVDVEEWLKQKGVVGQTNITSLQESYRKAAGAPIGFEFPFYGHKITNLTIATGGFCYVGDQMHSWLAATQYVAPLMANFDTMAKNSSIAYATDNKSKMVISWINVRLRDLRDIGTFHFQVHLLATGDIYFVYKDIPMEIDHINDANHPCKLGISDAYLFNHRFGNEKMPNAMQTKRVIHEYHRITVQADKVKSNSVVILKALPTCLQFADCKSCASSNLKTFNCSWCDPKDPKQKGFCSDQAGLHRRRQEWVEGDCALTGKGTSNTCDATTTTPAVTTITSATPEIVTAPEADLQNERERLEMASKSSGGGMAVLTVFLLLLLAAGCWFVYAFYNPHTTSGQLLIKYRPSKWQIPSSHVRYSANVHM